MTDQAAAVAGAGRGIGQRIASAFAEGDRLPITGMPSSAAPSISRTRLAI
jgi:NAD(P)-dependent dehydrogenase (short-subunit alcohol dehydrogenase family)